MRCRGPVVNCQRVHSHGDGRGESDARRRGRARRRPRRRRALTSTHRSGCPIARADRRAPKLQTQPVVLSAPTSLCASRRRQRRVHSHLGDGGGEGDARRLTLALVRCRPPGSQLLVLSTARSSSPGYHLDVLKPMHAEASSTCAVMGTGVGKATLGFRIPVGFRMLCSESPQISTTDRTHARTGPDTQRAQVRRLRSQFPPCNHAQPSLHS